jgi:hypothetical protein
MQAIGQAVSKIKPRAELLKIKQDGLPREIA